MTTAAKAKFQKPASRWAVSVLAAVGLHVLILAAAWPWVKPFVIPSPSSSNMRRIDRQAIEDAINDSPIIMGSVSNDSPGIDEGSYASLSWDQTAAVPPEKAQLPFSFSRQLRTGDVTPLAAPPRRAIARPTPSPTIHP